MDTGFIEVGGGGHRFIPGIVVTVIEFSFQQHIGQSIRSPTTSIFAIT